MQTLALPTRPRGGSSLSTGYQLAPAHAVPAPAPVLTPTPGAATFNPAQRYDASGRPTPAGGSSANFQASLARDRTVAPANTALQATRNTIMADANAAAPPTPVTDPATGRPKMGTAYARLADGTEVTRQYRQTAEPPQVKEARREALALTLPPDTAAAGEQAFASSVAGSKAAFDARQPLDPKLLVAKSVATMNDRHAALYDTQGKVATQRAEDNTGLVKSQVALNETRGANDTTRATNDTTRASNDTTRSAAQADANTALADYRRQQRDRLATLAGPEKEKLQQQVQLLISQGNLAEAHALLAGEQVTTEQQTRPGKVEGQQIKNRATADANERANREEPSRIYRNTTQGLHNTLNPITGKPIEGAPQPPLAPPPMATPAPVITPSTPLAGPGGQVAGGIQQQAAPAPAAQSAAPTTQPVQPSPAQQAPAVGATAVNRQTGQRLRWTGSGWEAVQ
jgi:hypothetical protein